MKKVFVLILAVVLATASFSFEREGGASTRGHGEGVAKVISTTTK